MEKNRNIKRTLQIAGLLSGALLITLSCSNAQKPEDTKVVAEDHNEAKFENRSTEKDAQFLVNAAEINLKEILLGQLAMDRSMNKSVMALGKMMHDAHEKSLNDLKTLAGKKSMTIPVYATQNAQDTYKKLSDKSGLAFDKEYCDMMVKGHKDAIAEFEKASAESTDTDISQWATGMLPDLRMHLDHAIDCQKKCEKTE